MDIFETRDAVVVRAEIPGVRGDDIRVNVDGDLLRISGLRRVPANPGIKRLHQMEIAFGPFEREVRIALAFDKDKVAAHLEDGFLVVTLTKRASGRRQVSVETE